MWRDKAATWSLARGSRRDDFVALVRRAHAELLARRPRAPSRLGLWLRRVPGVHAARPRLGRFVARAGPSDGRLKAEIPAWPNGHHTLAVEVYDGGVDAWSRAAMS